jgi:hypothetical protein
MAGFIPAIHVDPRDEPGDDVKEGAYSAAASVVAALSLASSARLRSIPQR